MPAARLSSTTLTMTRVPRTVAWPWYVAGSRTMSRCWFSVTETSVGDDGRRSEAEATVGTPSVVHARRAVAARDPRRSRRWLGPFAGRTSPIGSLDAGSPLLGAGPHPSHERLGNALQVRDDAGVEDGVSLSGRKPLQLCGGPHPVWHRGKDSAETEAPLVPRTNGMGRIASGDGGPASASDERDRDRRSAVEGSARGGNRDPSSGRRSPPCQPSCQRTRWQAVLRDESRRMAGRR